MRYQSIFAPILVALLAIVPMVPVAFATPLPGDIDVLRHTVIRSPDAALLAMMTGVADISPDQIRTTDIETQADAGMLVTENLGFHMGFIGYNIRADQSYRREDVTYWPLKDAEFRHALVHCYDQQGIIPPIYGYIVTPVRSLVPPAQSRYFNTAIPEHSYNPGDPFTSPEGEHSTCGILKAAGYTFVDDDSSGTVTDADYWLTPAPGSVPLPTMEVWTPLLEVAPTSFQHGQEFASDLAAIGLGATTANGMKGIHCDGEDFNWYLAQVYDHADFDGYMVFYSLGRIPSQLYSLLNSHQDSFVWPGRRNAVGVNDPTIDDLTDIVKYSLDLEEIENAAKTVQEMVYTPTLPNADNFALSYMTLYSRSYFNVFAEHVEGVVRSPGYGSDNSWTRFNMGWEDGFQREEDGKNVMIYINGEHPSSFNPLYATTVYEWNIIGITQDVLTAVNPWNHRDIPWQATDWTITETVAGMDIDFVLDPTVEWQDGKPMTASDVEFCLEFLRDYQVPRYAETWETLIDVSVTDATHLTISVDEAGVDLFYDYSALALRIPEHIWDRFGDPTDPANRQAVLDYDPSVAYNVAPGYIPGPHPTPTNLFGTGPWIFQFYDDVNFYDDMERNPNYFMTIGGEIRALMVEMFWEVGDVNKDGIVDVYDQMLISESFGYFWFQPGYNPDADLNQDGIVDIRDLAIHGYYLGWQREYP
ncbi:MAG: ABC transporter substrate-binding protein [Candidatus Bathyarchaeota archaeon]